MTIARAAPQKAHKPHVGDPVKVGSYEVRAAGTQYQIGECFEDRSLVIVPLTDTEFPGLFGCEYRILWAPLKDFGGAPAGWFDFLRGVIDRLESGQKLLAYCVGSHGRTGMFLASLIALLEDQAQTPDPIAAVRQRHCERAVETYDQIEAVFALRGQPVPLEYQKLKRERLGLSTKTATSPPGGTRRPVEGVTMSDPNEQFYMPGTEGSGEYIVLAASSFGRLGYRELPGGVVRVRLEPTPRKTAVIAAVLTRESGWKQPGDQGQERFSTVTDCDEAEDAIKTAFALIKRGRPLAYNPNAPKV